MDNDTPSILDGKNEGELLDMTDSLASMTFIQDQAKEDAQKGVICYLEDGHKVVRPPHHATDEKDDWKE